MRGTQKRRIGTILALLAGILDALVLAPASAAPSVQAGGIGSRPSVAEALAGLAPAPGTTPEAEDDGTLLVEVAAGAGPDAVLRAHGLRRVESAGLGAGTVRARRTLAAAPLPVAGLAELLRRDPRVVVAEPNGIRRAAATPTDPGWATLQAPYLGPLRVERALDQSGGAGVVVAVLDTGVDLDHPDLAGSLLPGWDFVNNDSVPQDDFGHGTEVAGVIAARMDNGRGVAGVAPSASILPVKVLNASGSGNDATISAGIRWATDHGADVINLSLGGYLSSVTLADAVAYARAHDVVVVAAAGNDGTDEPSFPAALPGVVAVSATDDDGELVLFSNHGDWVDVAAPGVAITTTKLVVGPGEDYAFPSGTSFSSPIVAGVAALARQRFPAESEATIVNRLQATARDNGPRGRDRAYGAGMVDAFAATGGPLPGESVEVRTDGTEPNDTPAQATPLVVGTPATGRIAVEGDEDWFAVDLPIDGTYVVDVSAIVRSSGDVRGFDPMFDVFDSGGRLVSSVDAATTDQPEHRALPLRRGHWFVRVRNFLGTESPLAATPTYSLSMSLDAAPFDRFEDRRWAGGADERGVAVADLTGDGLLDVAVTRPGEVKVFGQQPGGTFDTAHVAAHPADIAGPADGGVAAADLDGDGNADLAVATASGLEVWFQSAGVLGGRVTVVGAPGERVRLADVDGDGRIDAVTGDGTFLRLASNTAAGFVVTPIGASTDRHLDVGDVTGDGRPDVVTSGSEGAVWVQQVAGTFTKQVLVSGGDRPPTAEQTGDIDGDGRRDIVFVRPGSAAGTVVVEVWPQPAAGGLGSAPAQSVTLPSVASVQDLRIGDADGDGRADLLLRHDSQVLVLLQRADGTYPTSVEPGPVLGPDPSEPDVMAAADVDADGRLDAVVGTRAAGTSFLRQRWSASARQWELGATPAGGATGVAADVVPTITVAPGLDPASVTGSTVRLTSGPTGAAVPATVTLVGSTIRVTPSGPLAPGTYRLVVDGLTASPPDGLDDLPWASAFTVAPAPVGVAPETTIDAVPSVTSSATTTFTMRGSVAGSTLWCRLDDGAWSSCTSPLPVTVGVGAHRLAVFAVAPTGHDDRSDAAVVWTYLPPAPPPPPPAPPAPPAPPPPPSSPPARFGYRMVSAVGDVYAFGDASYAGGARSSRPFVDVESTPSGNGYWLVDDAGRVSPFGDAAFFGDGAGRSWSAGERVTSLSATPSGGGYWLFTSIGRVVPFGDAGFFGDMAAVRLNGPVLDSVPTPSGQGYYLVASDGGIFTFGDAVFRGSMGGVPLNAPVQSLVPDADGVGYWLVASDGGIFTFEAGFFGSMGDVRLNRPITGMVASGSAGYLMVGEDGGIFTFGDTPFAGSLGASPPASPITSVSVLPR